MNLKNKIIALAVAALLAVGAWFYFKPKPVIPVKKEVHKSVKKVEYRPDGSISSITSTTVSSKTEPQRDFDYLSFGGYADSKFHAGVSLGLKLNTWDFDLDSDLKQDHRLTAKKIIFQW